MVMQLDLFLSPYECEIYQLKKGQKDLKTSLDKIRRGTYSEINILKKVCVELSARQEIIERGLCSGR